MTGKPFFLVLYVYDETETPFRDICDLKVFDHKIEEVCLDVKERLEKRDDITLILKKHKNISLYLAEKDLILCMGVNGFRIVNPKRARGVNFEMSRAAMASYYAGRN